MPSCRKNEGERRISRIFFFLFSLAFWKGYGRSLLLHVQEFARREGSARAVKFAQSAGDAATHSRVCFTRAPSRSIDYFPPVGRKGRERRVGVEKRSRSHGGERGDCGGGGGEVGEDRREASHFLFLSLVPSSIAMPSSVSSSLLSPSHTHHSARTHHLRTHTHTCAISLVILSQLFPFRLRIFPCSLKIFLHLRISTSSLLYDHM